MNSKKPDHQAKPQSHQPGQPQAPHHQLHQHQATPQPPHYPQMPPPHQPQYPPYYFSSPGPYPSFHHTPTPYYTSNWTAPPTSYQTPNPLTNMVQAQANLLPQPSNKPSTQQQNNAAPQTREKKLAVLKKPDTLEEIPLGNPDTTSSSATDPTKSVHTLLQKVSEDNSISEKKSEKSSNQDNPVQKNSVPNKVTSDDKDKTGESDATKATVKNDKLETTPLKNKSTEPTNETSNNKENVNDAKCNQNSTTIIGDQKDKPDSAKVSVASPSHPDASQETKKSEPNATDDSQNTTDKDSKVEDETERLQYEPGQYHPTENKSGKRVYSRKFLLDVCEKICKLDLSEKKNGDKPVHEGPDHKFDEKVDFLPSFASSHRYASKDRQNEPVRRQNPHNYTGRGSSGQERQRKVISSSSLTQEVELKTSNNPWRPAKEVKEDKPVDAIETETLKKKFRSILNKLTPNNFENLAKAVTDLQINTEARLGEVIDIVLAKALAEPGYCVLYGRMCSHLRRITAGQANFGNTLLKRCQHQFQSDIYAGLNIKERNEKIDAEQDADVKKQLQEELYEDMYRCRLRNLGLIKFIGELYKIEMLNDRIMSDCVKKLLQDTTEETLECLCDLLTTIGEKLDHSTKKTLNAEKEKRGTAKNVSKTPAYQSGQKSAAAVVASSSTSEKSKVVDPELSSSQVVNLDDVFGKMHKIRKDQELPLSVRIRFKILDTCELREKYNWQLKKNKDNPKKLEEIREAHKEKLEEERRHAVGPRRSQEASRRPLGSSSQLSSLANESGIEETQREHQRRIESFKNLSISKGISAGASKEPLAPRSRISLRPARP